MDTNTKSAFVIQQAIELMKIQHDMGEDIGFTQAVAMIRSEFF